MLQQPQEGEEEEEEEEDDDDDDDESYYLFSVSWNSYSFMNRDDDNLSRVCKLVPLRRDST